MMLCIFGCVMERGLHQNWWDNYCCPLFSNLCTATKACYLMCTYEVRCNVLQLEITWVRINQKCKKFQNRACPFKSLLPKPLNLLIFLLTDRILSGTIFCSSYEASHFCLHSTGEKVCKLDLTLRLMGFIVCKSSIRPLKEITIVWAFPENGHICNQ